MKVIDVKATILEGNFDWLIVRVDTDEGISGFGECFAPWQASETVKPIVLSMKPLLLGEDPTDVEALLRKMGPSARGGLHVQAISGVEMALWDIAGKALDAPLYKLLGGKHRSRIKIYADCHAGKLISSRESYSVDKREDYTAEAYAENARRVKKLGYTFLKFDLYPNIATVGGPQDLVEGNLSNMAIRYLSSVVEAARETLGDDIELAVDFGGYNTSDAIRLANALERYNLAWVEDVVPADNIEAMAKVTASVKTPTLTGETLYTRHGFRELIEKQVVKIVAPDLSFCGGLSEGKKIAEMADLYYMLVTPHNICSPIGTMAVVHACAAMPNFLALEFHSLAVPWWEDLVKGGKPLIKEGYIELPEKPGIGIELNEEEVRKHLKEGETFFE